MTPATAVAADPNFDISVVSDYTVRENGTTRVVQTIKILNKSEYYFTPTYSVSVGFKNIENIEAHNSDGGIPTTLQDEDSLNKKIKLTFPKRYAGLNSTHTFVLTFDTKDIAQKQGNIWEVTIPGIDAPDDFSDYSIAVRVPEKFGKASIIKPSKKESGLLTTFEKEEIGKGGVYILYGDKQYYSFTLKYNISNPNLFPVRTEIALPPTTNYQNVIISSLSEKPIDTTRDKDGNWIAEYRLLPQQKNTIIAKGYVEVTAQPGKSTHLNSVLKDYVSPKKFWESKDASIVKEAEKLKTPREIYDYVVNTLSYNYSKVATDNLRLGGKGVLKNPKNSVCLEFTDLFVTLARANGIPARAVEGYAYTKNPKLRPISLANDILHAWPEYYDEATNTWIMVDPTWGNTTHNIDYFDSLDFAHVAFVVKGGDSEYPIPAGGYKFDRESKDVEIAFADADEFKIAEKITIEDTFPSFVFPKTTIQGTITVKNEGNSGVSDLTIDVVTGKGSRRQFVVDYIPPFGSRKVTTSFSDVPLLTNGSYLITMQVGKTITTKSVRISLIPDFKILLFIGGIIGGSAIITAVTFHTGGLLVQRRKQKNSIRR